MGAILATPGKSTRNEVRMGEQNNNNNVSNNNLSSSYNHNNNNSSTINGPSEKNQQKVPFAKFNIVHECFPSLAVKENKFFNEKVPSYWSKTKNDTKKKTKQKILPTIHVNNLSDTKISIQPIEETILPDAEPIKSKQQTIRKLSSGIDKHYYGTLNLSETLKYIGCYVYLRCRNLEGLKPSIVVGWVRGVDRNLVLSGWQEIGFISQPNMIVLYMLLREVIPAKVRSTTQLKAIMMSTLYMCYAYNGHEISYPLKPFIFDNDRANFWNRCMEIINGHSDKLLRANKDPKYYNEIQVELKTFGRSLERKDR